MESSGNRDLLRQGTLSYLSEDCVISILKQAFDAVFVFDVRSDIFTCLYIREPPTSLHFNVRMMLSDAMSYWLDNLVESKDRPAVDDFMMKHVFRRSAAEREASLNFSMRSREGRRERFSSVLYELSDEKYLFCCRNITKRKTQFSQILYRGSDIVTFDYDVASDELDYSFSLPELGYQEITLPSFLADLEMLTLFREAQLHTFRTYIDAVLNGEEVEEFEILLNPHSRGFEWYAMQLFGLKDQSGRVYRVVGKTQSIQKARERHAKQLRTEAAIQIALSSDALYSAAFDTTTGERVAITGEVIPEPLRHIQRVSQIFEHLKQNIYPQDFDRILSLIVDSNILTPGNMTRKQKCECRFHTADLAPGEYKWVQITYMYAFNELVEGPVLYFFVMDIDEEKKHVLQMLDRSRIDSTTKFLTRPAFESFCETERKNMNSPLGSMTNALVILEIKFDEELLGYEGLQRMERIAEAFAETVQGWAREEDVPARFSDAKFLICMHALESQAALLRRLETLQEVLDSFTRKFAGVSIYMGMTRCCHDVEKGYRCVYDQAELALLLSKERGEPQTVFFSDDLGQKAEIRMRKKVYIRTFGHFEVFLDQKPVFFKTAKAKELLALLVDRRGSYLSTDEAISYLWENEPANKVTRARYRKVALRLKEILEANGIGDIVELSDHRRRIVMESVQCDLFDFVSGKASASDMFSGVYMQNYSWAEVTAAQLTKNYWAI